MTRYRKERDVLGPVKVPAQAYYGSETQRALDNFRVSGLRMQHEFIRAYVMVKLAAARANVKAGKLDPKKGNAIARACGEILSGKLSDQFVVDVFQAGAGTSMNMNINEVIANRAIELLGGRRGDYRLVHPNDHVNMSQSTNDTVPTAMRIAAYIEVKNKLLPALKHLEKALRSKSSDFSRIVKVGRTHMQDAVPMTLGEEFSGYAGAVSESISIIEDASVRLLDLPIGGTAVGTGINAGPKYRKGVVIQLRRITHLGFRSSRNVFADMQNRIAELALSQALGETAVALNKIANDLRILASGPRAGIGDIKLPEVQPGSSIMPGKINPSIAEMMNMVCFQVMGNNETVAQAANAGQLELNVFMPIMAFNILFSIQILSNGSRTFADRCIRGIRANMTRINEHLERNLSLATALTPYIGYKKAAEIARKAYLQNKTVKEICLRERVLDEETLNRVLDSKRLSG